MVRVVLDTNLIVSSLVNPRTPPSRVMDFFSRKLIDVIVSVEIVLEYRTVLTRPTVMGLHKRSSEEIDELILGLEKHATQVFPLASLYVVKGDPDDNKFIECAVAGGADFIISGDKHLLALGSYDGIQIVTPAMFVAYLEQHPD